MERRRFPRWLIVLGALAAALVLVIVFWRWDWFIPLVEARATAALGRRVTIAHLHVRPGRVTEMAADGITIANPEGFPADSHFGTVKRLAVDFDVMAFLRDWGAIRLPRIAATQPDFDVRTAPDGAPNWKLALGSAPGGSSGAPVQIGALLIDDGHARVVIPALKTDFALEIATRAPKAGAEAALVVNAKGTYAAQPVTGTFVGGSLLSLRDPARPYPIDLRAANGGTRVTIAGTVQDPLAFKGTDVKLTLSGPDMGQLYHMTGIPIPETPPYQISGKLDYADRKIRFTDFAGRLGHSDIGGTIAVDPGTARPQVIADLTSRNVDLADLGGFIGTTPGRAGQGQTPQQQREKAQEERSGNLLPDQPLNLPKLEAADVDLKYRGGHIVGRDMPLDDVAADITIRDGAIDVHPVSFGVGKGRIVAQINVAPKTDKAVAMKADVAFRQVDVARLMASTGVFGGAGTIGGQAVVSGNGSSIAQIMAGGDGELKLFMTGGDLSALLVSLAGLDIGNSLLSALGLPTRTTVRCMIADMPLEQGLLRTRVLLIDTTEANIVGTGTVNFRNETLNYQIKTDSKHFSIGKLNVPIDVTGRLKDPSILPDPGALAVRGGAAALLGTLLTPLAALLPTVELGLGEDTDCSRTIAAAGSEGKAKLSPAEIKRRTR
jgi:uncharacterized protein involved in outer membrane biogenesis